LKIEINVALYLFTGFFTRLILKKYETQF